MNRVVVRHQVATRLSERQLDVLAFQPFDEEELFLSSLVRALRPDEADPTLTIRRQVEVPVGARAAQPHQQNSGLARRTW